MGQDSGRYREVFEAATVGIIVIDEIGDVSLANQAAADMFGLQPSDIIGRPIMAALGHFLGPAARAKAERRLVERTTADSYEMRITKADGSEAAIYVAATPLHRPDGSFDGSIAVITDISDRVAAEDALQVRERQLQLIMDQLPAVLTTTDADLRITSTAGAGLARLGVKPNQTKGMTMYEYVAAGGEPDHPVIGRFLRVLEGEEVSFEDVWAGHTYLVHAAPLRDADGTIVGMMNLGLDIEDQKQAERQRELLQEELRQAQKLEAIGRLAGGLAHDFNNLLTVIANYAGFLQPEVDAGQQRQDVEGIASAVDRAASLTRQLLAFSRQQVVDRTTLDLNDIVTDMERLLRRLIGEDVELVAALEPNLGAIEANRSQIEQVIVNLAVNARDAMPTGGKLVLETGQLLVDEQLIDSRLTLDPGPYVTLTIRDTGEGMDADTITRIFEPFFTTKQVGRGTGLGLSTAVGILEQSGAKVSVYSEKFRGTTFKVFFPRVTKALAEFTAPIGSAASSLTGTERVLLVEDEPVLRALVARTLASAGYETVEARYATEALDLLSQQDGPIDIVVSDIVMPGMSGVALAQRLAVDHPELRVVLMSGFSDRAAELRSGQIPRFAFVEKPFTQSELLRVVRTELDRPGEPGVAGVSPRSPGQSGLAGISPA